MRKRLLNGYGEFTELGKKAVKFLEKGINRLLNHRMFKNVDLPDIEAIVTQQGQWWSTGVASRLRGKQWSKEYQRQKEKDRKKLARKGRRYG